MIWQVARVLVRDADRLTLVFSAPETCARCARGHGCGAGVFSRLFSRRKTRVDLPSDLAVSAGDWVRVGLPPRALAGAAALCYGTPLLGFLGGAVAGHALAGDGPARDLFALSAGLAGFFAVTALVVRRLPWTLNPVLERLSCNENDTNSFVS